MGHYLHDQVTQTYFSPLWGLNRPPPRFRKISRGVFSGYSGNCASISE